MEPSRPAKRPRISYGGAYYDTVPLADGESVSTVHVSEGRLRKVGNKYQTVPFERVPQVLPDAWEEVEEWGPIDDPDYALDPDGKKYDELVEADVMAEQPTAKKKKPKKSKVSVGPTLSFSSRGMLTLALTQRRPHVVWMENSRQEYLDEILRWAGRGDFRNSRDCPDCLSRKVQPPGPARYRCEECFSPDLVCGGCCVKRHRSHPLHWIQVRDFRASFFVFFH